MDACVCVCECKMVAHSLIISQAIDVDHLQLLAFILITTNKKQCLMCDAFNLLWVGGGGYFSM